MLFFDTFRWAAPWFHTLLHEFKLTTLGYTKVITAYKIAIIVSSSGKPGSVPFIAIARIRHLKILSFIHIFDRTGEVQESNIIRQGFWIKITVNDDATSLHGHKAMRIRRVWYLKNALYWVCFMYTVGCSQYKSICNDFTTAICSVQAI